MEPRSFGAARADRGGLSAYRFGTTWSTIGSNSPRAPERHTGHRAVATSQDPAARQFGRLRHRLLRPALAAHTLPPGTAPVDHLAPLGDRIGGWLILTLVVTVCGVVAG
ncbi:MAG: hypothetical protein OXK79_00340 [Chloroflexota bacterium]|nr:hypothetical protein [Chloroflexota bacterium]